MGAVADFAVVLVHTTSHAIHAERVLKRAGVGVKLIPTPRHLSSDCGSSVRIADEDRERAERLLTENNVPIDRVEPLTK